MKRPFARKLRLRPSIVALFVVLTVPVFFAIVAVTYVSNEAIARANADAADRAVPHRSHRQHPGHVQPDQVAGARRGDGRQPATRFLFRQSLAQIPAQHPAAQRQARQRLCRPGRRVLPPGPADQPGRRRSRTSCRRPASDTPIAGSSHRADRHQSTTISSSMPAEGPRRVGARPRPTTRDCGFGIGRPPRTANSIITDPDIFAALG